MKRGSRIDGLLVERPEVLDHRVPEGVSLTGNSPEFCCISHPDDAIRATASHHQEPTGLRTATRNTDRGFAIVAP